MTLMVCCLWNFLLLGSTVQIGEAEPAFHYLWLEKLSFWASTPTVKIKWRWMSLILNLQPMQWKHSDSILRLSESLCVHHCHYRCISSHYNEDNHHCKKTVSKILRQRANRNTNRDWFRKSSWWEEALNLVFMTVITVINMLMTIIVMVEVTSGTKGEVTTPPSGPIGRASCLERRQRWSYWGC